MPPHLYTTSQASVARTSIPNFLAIVYVKFGLLSAQEYPYFHLCTKDKRGLFLCSFKNFSIAADYVNYSATTHNPSPDFKNFIKDRYCNIIFVKNRYAFYIHFINQNPCKEEYFSKLAAVT